MISCSFPWSISGSTSISSIIVADPATETYPSWISINADYLHLNVNTLSYGASNDYTFVIRSAILGQNVDQYTTITVYKCQVANWSSWAYSSLNIWNSWVSPNTLSVDGTTWINPLESIPPQPTPSPSGSTAAQPASSSPNGAKTPDTSVNNSTEYSSTISIVSIIVVSGGIGASIINELVFGSTCQSIWALVNQFQLYLLIPFFKSYLTISFISVLSNFSIAFYNFKFLSGIKLYFFDDKINEIDYLEPDDRFKDSGLSSGSFIVNEYNFFKSLLFVIIVNIIFIIGKVILKISKTEKFSGVIKFLLEYFHFKIYIRMILEGHLFWLLASMNENYIISSARLHTTSYILSILSSLSAFSLFPIIIVLFIFWKDSKYLLELFEMTKNERIKKLYNLFFILRRTLMVFTIIFMKDAPAISKLIINVLIQLIALAYSSIIRPLKEINDWFVDIVNDFMFLIFWIILWFIEEESTRSNSLSTVLIILLIINQFTVWVINMSFFAVQSVKKLIKLYKSRRDKQNDIHPHTKVSPDNVLVLKVKRKNSSEGSRELSNIINICLQLSVN